eukprot:499121-Pleurochrysis_carterae.AAC.1
MRGNFYHSNTELLARNGVHATTCPPHVHQFYGVAERAIRSVMELTRSILVASGALTSFWTYAVAHSVDVLNRSTGPPRSSIFSYEALTGTKPRVMSILSFGCRAFAVKPRVAYAKIRIEPRAWVGTNLGRSLTSPDAYNVYVPSVPRVVLTSEVYFDESTFPWKPTTPAQATPVTTVSVDAGSDQPPGLPQVSPTDEAASRLHQIPHAVPDVRKPAHTSRTVLLLSSGPFKRPDGISAFLRQADLQV